MKNTITSFKLEEASCDKIADLIMGFCESIGTERKEALKYRLSAEESFMWTPQSKRFEELRDNATARMLGTEYIPEVSEEEKEYGELLLYIFGDLLLEADEGR